MNGVPYYDLGGVLHQCDVLYVIVQQIINHFLGVTLSAVTVWGVMECRQSPGY